jgi:HlyD family secretion protein
LLLLVAVWLGRALLVPRPLSAELALVSRGSLMVSIDNEGMARVQDRYVIAAPVAGKLNRITLQIGDDVKADTVVALLSPQPADLQQQQQIHARLQAADAQALAATQQLQQAVSAQQFSARERLRIDTLRKQGFLSAQTADRTRTEEQTARSEVSAADARARAAQAEVRIARAAVNALRTDPQQTIMIRAPSAGKVLDITQKSERTLAAGTPLVVLGNLERAEIVVDVLSTDAVKIQPGMMMLLDDWGGNQTLRARVRRVEPVAFTKISALGVEEQRVNVVADPVDSPGRLGDGYRVQARIVVWHNDAVLKIPGSSVFRVADRWHVFVMEDGRARRREIQTGQRNRDEVQVLAGLTEGMRIVRFPGNQLTDGMRVTENMPGQ